MDKTGMSNSCILIKEEKTDEIEAEIPTMVIKQENESQFYYEGGLSHVKHEGEELLSDDGMSNPEDFKEEKTEADQPYIVCTRGGIKKMRGQSGSPFEPLSSTFALSNPLSSTSSASSAISSNQRRMEDLNVPKFFMDEEFQQIMAEDDEDENLEDIGEDWDDSVENTDFEILADSENSEGEEDCAGYLVPQVTLSGPSAPSRQWTRQPPSRPHIPFTQIPGLTRDISKLTTPLDFLELFLSAELFTLIVTQTNFYAQYLLSKAKQPNALIRKWKPLDLGEFKIFLGLLYHMGTIPLNRMADYWSTDPILFAIPCFRRVMSRDRFLGILQALHFAQNPEPDKPIPTDQLYKIRSLIGIFNGTMDQLILPTKNLTVESMVLWRGQLIFKQFIKNKANPYGIKLYMLNETAGLVLRFIVEMGASDKEIGKRGTNSVVRKLMAGKLDVGHSLFMDKFYNSVTLVHELLERNTYVTGTLRKDRKGNPSEIINAKPKKGEVFDMHSDKGVCVLNWKDKRDVLMISSEFSGQMVNVTTQGVLKQKPEMFLKYSESMGGIDRFDQMMAYYPIKRKPLKWTKKLGIHILHICLYNAFTLYNKYYSKITLYDFRNSVIKLLLPPPSVSPSKIRPLQRSGNRGLPLHFPAVLGNIEGTNRKMRKRCRVCLENRRRTDTSIYCPACPDHPNLCLENCFLAFHKDIIF